MRGNAMKEFFILIYVFFYKENERPVGNKLSLLFTRCEIVKQAVEIRKSMGWINK